MLLEQKRHPVVEKTFGQSLDPRIKIMELLQVPVSTPCRSKRQQTNVVRRKMSSTTDWADALIRTGSIQNIHLTTAHFFVCNIIVLFRKGHQG